MTATQIFPLHTEVTGEITRRTALDWLFESVHPDTCPEPARIARVQQAAIALLGWGEWDHARWCGVLPTLTDEQVAALVGEL